MVVDVVLRFNVFVFIGIVDLRFIIRYELYYYDILF